MRSHQGIQFVQRGMLKRATTFPRENLLPQSLAPQQHRFGLAGARRQQDKRKELVGDGPTSTYAAAEPGKRFDLQTGINEKGQFLVLFMPHQLV